MDRDKPNGDSELKLVGAGPDIMTMGAGIRMLINGLGGVPALDDRTMGMLSAIHHARNMQQAYNASNSFKRVYRRTCLGDNSGTEGSNEDGRDDKAGGSKTGE